MKSMLNNICLLQIMWIHYKKQFSFLNIAASFFKKTSLEKELLLL